MKMFRALTAAAAGVVMLGATGCFRTTKLVQKTMAPDVYRSASVETLEKEVSARDAAIKTLNAAVLVTASVGGSATGKVTTYTSFRGYIFVRKPSDLRVLLQLPVLGSRALDMVSNGQTFTLMRASSHGDVWMQGNNTVTKPSKNGLENLRPPVFFDSLLVKGVSPDEYVGLTDSTRILPSPTKKRTDIEEPDYDLTVSKIKSGNVFETLRVIHISRVTMLPYEQDIYDEQGNPVTIATYDDYKTVDGIEFPMLIRIERPQDQYALKVDITKLTLNQPLENDQFELKVPAGVKVQTVE